MKLSEISNYVEDKINSRHITLNQYITTDSLLPDKQGRVVASNLPPVSCSLTHYQEGDVLVANIRPYLKKIWRADQDGGCSLDVLVFRAKNIEESNFLYALLQQDSFFSYSMLGAKGSKMPRGDKAQIMDYPITPLLQAERKFIGDFSIKITEKISINRSLNHNLPIPDRSSGEGEARRVA